jgi:broad-specificity NMP kinase
MAKGIKGKPGRGKTAACRLVALEATVQALCKNNTYFREEMQGAERTVVLLHEELEETKRLFKEAELLAIDSATSAAAANRKVAEVTVLSNTVEAQLSARIYKFEAAENKRKADEEAKRNAAHKALMAFAEEFIQASPRLNGGVFIRMNSTPTEGYHLVPVVTVDGSQSDLTPIDDLVKKVRAEFVRRARSMVPHFAKENP